MENEHQIIIALLTCIVLYLAYTTYNSKPSGCASPKQYIVGPYNSLQYVRNSRARGPFTVQQTPIPDQGYGGISALPPPGQYIRTVNPITSGITGNHIRTRVNEVDGVPILGGVNMNEMFEHDDTHHSMSPNSQFIRHHLKRSSGADSAGQMVSSGSYY